MSVYYQFREDIGYPVFIQFKEIEIEKELQTFIYQMGLSLSTKEAVEKLKQNKGFRVLTVSLASQRVAKRIQSYSLHSFGLGNELIENFGYYEVYILFHQALMIVSQNGAIWELALIREHVLPLIEDQNKTAIRLSINRFLSSALSFFSVMSFWGSMQDNAWKVCQQNEANGYCSFVDLEKGIIFAQAQMKKKINEVFLYLNTPNLQNRISPEDIYSYLASRCLYFSAGQIPKSFILENLRSLVVQLNSSSYLDAKKDSSPHL